VVGCDLAGGPGDQHRVAAQGLDGDFALPGEGQPASGAQHVVAVIAADGDPGRAAAHADGAGLGEGLDEDSVRGDVVRRHDAVVVA
jgi:hypothetical protein